MQRRAHAAAVRHRLGAHAVTLEIVAQEAADLRIIVDDQNVFGPIHGSFTYTLAKLGARDGIVTECNGCAC